MKKFLSVALAAVMMLSLAACGSSSNKAESSSEGGSASDKTYIIATDTTFAPFEFTNDKNEFVGIDVDILAAIAKDQGFKYDLQPLGFDAAVAALESGQADDGRLAAEAVGEKAEHDAAEAADTVDGAEEGASLCRVESLIRHEEVRAHRSKAPVRDDVENLDQDAEPDDFVKADRADCLNQMNALDVRRGIRVFSLEAEDQQQAEDDGGDAHVRQADAPVPRALQASAVIRWADIRADGVERHHESVEHGTGGRENRAGYRVHDDIPAAFKNTEADTPQGGSSKAGRSRDAGGHAAEADHAENQHALAAEPVREIAGRDIDECLPEREDGADRAELDGGQRQRCRNSLEADAEGKAVRRVKRIAECQQEQLKPEHPWHFKGILLFHHAYVLSGSEI